jgi:hypothetical protein
LAKTLKVLKIQLFARFLKFFATLFVHVILFMNECNTVDEICRDPLYHAK